MNKTALVALMASCLAGCALLKPEPTPPPPVQFNYATANSASTGLVRVFNLKGDTVLQFIDISAAQPKVYEGEETTPLPYQVVGQYAVVSGVRQSLRVVTKGGNAAVTRTAPPPTASTAAELARLDAVRPAEPVEPVLVGELAQMKKELAEARQALAQLRPQSNIKPAALIVPVAVADPTRTWTLQGNKTLKDNLADLAREAGYSEPRWKAANPYMVTYTTTYTGTFLDVVGKLAGEVPALDFRVYSWKHTIEVADAGN